MEEVLKSDPKLIKKIKKSIKMQKQNKKKAKIKKNLTGETIEENGQGSAGS